MAGGLPLQLAGGRAAVGGGALDNRWEDRIESRNAEENEWSFDPSTQSPLPFDTTAAPPAEASAPAASRCESCGAPANAPGLCSACERAFHTVLESPVDTQPAESDDHAAQLDALFRALDSAPPAVAAAQAPAPVDAPAVAAFDAAPAADPYAASEFVFASAPRPAPQAASEPPSPVASTFFMPPFAAPAGAGDHMSHTPASEPARVPFANITAAAEPRPLLFAGPLPGAPDTSAAAESEAPSEYRSVLLPAEPAEEPPVNAASPAPPTDVDFSTVMMPRLSTAQLEAAQSPLAAAAEASPVSYEPVIAQASDLVIAQASEPVVAQVSEPVVETQAVAPAVEPPAVEAIEPAVAVATPPIRLKLRDDPPPPVAPVIPVIEEHVVDEAPAAASPSPAAVAAAAQPAVESKSAPAPAQSQKPAAAKAPAAQSSPAKSRSALRGLATAAAVLLIVGAIGVPLGRLWLGRGQQIVPVAATAPHPAPVQTATPKQQPAAPQAVPAAATAVTTAAATPAPAAAAPMTPAPPAATGKPPTRAAAKPAAAEPPVPQIAAVAPTFVGEAPPAAALPAPEPIAPAPVAAAAPESPIGPFYETRSVDQAPQVTNRVEPRLPASLQGQPLKEIVIVRVLVSQTGKAALTSVLRRSKAGLELDNAVLAAVRQWSFTPAMKKGEAVSCFLHVGVAVGE